MPGAREALDRLRAAGVATAVVSNQSGVAPGVSAGRAGGGGQPAGRGAAGPLGPWLVCLHGPADGCRCRKPAPGLIEAAAGALGVDAAGLRGHRGHRGRRGGGQGRRGPGGAGADGGDPATRRCAAAPEVAADLLARSSWCSVLRRAGREPTCAGGQAGQHRGRAAGRAGGAGGGGRGRAGDPAVRAAGAGGRRAASRGRRGGGRACGLDRRRRRGRSPAAGIDALVDRLADAGDRPGGGAHLVPPEPVAAGAAAADGRGADDRGGQRGLPGVAAGRAAPGGRRPARGRAGAVAGRRPSGTGCRTGTTGRSGSGGSWPPTCPTWAAGRYVVVHPGASVPARAWAPERHAALVDALVGGGRRVVVTGERRRAGADGDGRRGAAGRGGRPWGAGRPGRAGRGPGRGRGGGGRQHRAGPPGGGGRSAGGVAVLAGGAGRCAGGPGGCPTCCSGTRTAGLRRVAGPGLPGAGPSVPGRGPGGRGRRRRRPAGALPHRRGLGRRGAPVDQGVAG